MLLRLNIRNYALIEQLDVEFTNGLSVITGETGSGKSILLGALGLALGERGAAELLRNKAEKCVVEITFHVSADFKTFFEENDLDYAAETIIRREIAVGGKSRSFVNDTPVSAKLLKELGAKLIDVHSQFETSNLRSKEFRMNLLDAAAGQFEQATTFKKQFKKWQALKSDLEQMIEEDAKSKAESDFISFQLNELDAAGLESVDIAAIEEEAEMHRNAEGIIGHLSALVYRLEESDEATLPALKAALQNIDALATMHKSGVQLRDRLKSVYIELVDIAAEANRERDSIEGDPGRLKVLEETLDKLYSLSHKHRLNSAVELIDLRESFRAKLDHFEGLTDKIESLSKEVESAQKALLQLAKTLHGGRIQAAGLLEKNVKEKLALMKMTDAKLQFVFSVTEELNQFGQTGVELLFQANKGLDAQPLEKAASGGELSRLMLALKATTASFLSLPSLILDEVDTGVSGEVAARMADVMRGMSGEMQLIAISHLPQVAGKAQHHYKVFKETIGEQTFTRLISLTEAQRVEELAGMLSGENITDSARKHAKELLQD